MVTLVTVGGPYSWKVRLVATFLNWKTSDRHEATARMPLAAVLNNDARSAQRR